MLELTVRLIVSLAIVIGLLLVLARFGARKFRGNNGALVHVVHRQPLSRTSAVAVVTVGTRVLVLGTTEQQVSVLAELDPDELDLAALELDQATELTDVSYLPLPVVEDGLGSRRLVEDGAGAPRLVEEGAPAPVSKTPGSHRAAPAARSTQPPSQGALAGSVLSLATWKQALNAARRAS